MGILGICQIKQLGFTELDLIWAGSVDWGVSLLGYNGTFSDPKEVDRILEAPPSVFWRHVPLGLLQPSEMNYVVASKWQLMPPFGKEWCH